MKILFIGDIVGSGGIFCVKSLLPKLKDEYKLDFIIGNGDAVTNGFGIGKNHAGYLRKLGVDVITTGECSFYKRDMMAFFPAAPYVLRPANYPPGTPGRGYRIFQVGDQKIGVITLLGQAGFQRVHLVNPYTYIGDLVSRIKQETNIILLDYHAFTTAEKNTMFFHADGLLTAIIGTHNKLQSADERIMPKGTAVISDAGRTGSQFSIGGLSKDVELRKFLVQIPERSKSAWDKLMLQGVLIETNPDGTAASITRLQIPCEEVPSDRDRNSNED